MSLGLVGRKVGMMRIFTDDGDSIPVTVLDVSNNRVTQIKTPETDGYSAVQVTFGQRRASRVTKAAAGHLAKAGVEGGTVLKEFRVDAVKASEMKAGDVVPVGLFEVGQKVDVQGVTIGKGYAGVIKRYHFLPVVQHMVTRVPIMFLVQSVWRKTQVVCFLVSV